jgi:tetratricopeptide (TPR) repeat protein
VGNYYDDPKGIRRNRTAALHWYKRAYRRGDSAAAHNIGIVLRNEGKSNKALSWFKRAVKLGDDESNLEIAKYYLENENNPRQAIPHLERICRSNWVSEAGAEQAANLLKQIKKKTKRS